ncbi:MAG: hypothetical protein ABI114_06350 [Rhodanobacter sp.]
MHVTSSYAQSRQRLFAAASLWLFGGGALLLTTLVPPYTALLGWGPTFWLVAAPLSVLLALEPSLPRQLTMLMRRRKLPCCVWH